MVVSDKQEGSFFSLPKWPKNLPSVLLETVAGSETFALIACMHHKFLEGPPFALPPALYHSASPFPPPGQPVLPVSLPALAQ